MSYDAIQSVFMLLFCGYFAFGSTNKTAVQPKQKSGPFISTLVRAEKCANPTRPYQKELPAIITLELYKMGKRTLFRGNYTAYKPDSGAKFAIQDYFLVNGQWRQNFRMVGMSCHSRIAVVMGHILGIKFNKKTCSVPKGVYVFNNIDYDILDHVFLINREYGRMLRKAETYNTKGTIVCFEFEVAVTPKNK